MMGRWRDDTEEHPITLDTTSRMRSDHVYENGAPDFSKDEMQTPVAHTTQADRGEPHEAYECISATPPEEPTVHTNGMETTRPDTQLCCTVARPTHTQQKRSQEEPPTPISLIGITNRLGANTKQQG